LTDFIFRLTAGECESQNFPQAEPTSRAARMPKCTVFWAAFEQSITCRTKIQKQTDETTRLGTGGNPVGEF
jgi:hypothetical protein